MWECELRVCVWCGCADGVNDGDCGRENDDDCWRERDVSLFSLGVSTFICDNIFGSRCTL